jgi:hypothetical protein
LKMENSGLNRTQVQMLAMEGPTNPWHVWWTWSYILSYVESMAILIVPLKCKGRIDLDGSIHGGSVLLSLQLPRSIAYHVCNVLNHKYCRTKILFLIDFIHLRRNLQPLFVHQIVHRLDHVNDIHGFILALCPGHIDSLHWLGPSTNHMSFLWLDSTRSVVFLDFGGCSAWIRHTLSSTGGQDLMCPSSLMDRGHRSGVLAWNFALRCSSACCLDCDVLHFFPAASLFLWVFFQSVMKQLIWCCTHACGNNLNGLIFPRSDTDVG